MSKYKSSPTVAPWNPLWIVVWSFIFSPVFGSALQKKNYQIMNEWQEVQHTSFWSTAGLILFFGYLFAEPFLPQTNLSEFYFLSIWIVFYVLWTLTQGIRHIRIVKDRYGTAYHHKLWAKPIMFGVMGLTMWVVLSLTYIIALVLAGILQIPPQ